MLHSRNVRLSLDNFLTSPNKTMDCDNVTLQGQLPVIDVVLPNQVLPPSCFRVQDRASRTFNVIIVEVVWVHFRWLWAKQWCYLGEVRRAAVHLGVPRFYWPLHWRQNDYDSVSNHQPHSCLLTRLFRRRSKKTSKLHVTGLCVGNSPGPVNSPHKGPVTRKMFPFDVVIMRHNKRVHGHNNP